MIAHNSLATIALSVYNAVSQSGDMNEAQLLSFLRDVWEPDIEASHVSAGIGYLLERKMVLVLNGQVRMLARGKNGRGHLVLRDGTSLRMTQHWSP